METKGSGFRAEVRKLRKLSAYLRPYRWQARLTVFCLISGTSLPLLEPLLLKELIDKALPQKSLSYLLMLVGLMALIWIIEAVLIVGTDFFFLQVSNGVLQDLRRDMYSHLHELSLSFVSRHHSGQVTARILADVEQLRMLITHGLLLSVNNLFMIVFTLGFMFYLDPILTLLSFPCLGFSVLLVRRLSKPQGQYSRDLRTQYARLNQELQETLGGMKEIHAFGAIEAWKRKFSAELGDYSRLNLRLGLSGSLARFGGQLFMILGPVLIYLGGGWMTFRGALSIGTLVAFAAYLNRLSGPVSSLLHLNEVTQTVGASLDRVSEFLDQEPEIKEPADKIPLNPVQGEIEFRDVSFAYDGRKRVLAHINLVLNAGEKVALVGPSGSGKSTFFNLLYRFYQPQEGQILVDHVDIQRVGLDELRGSMVLIPQETFLFHGSVADNLNLGSEDLATGTMAQACTLAQAHDFVSALPMGYQTQVCERGGNFSGGQKQRLAIARALMKEAPIIVLDEALAALDPLAEGELIRTLLEALRGKTVLLATHRLQNLKEFDRILVFEKGRIIESGNYEELLSSDGFFARLDREQKNKRKRQTPNKFNKEVSHAGTEESFYRGGQ